MLELVDVCYGYMPNTNAVEDISLSFDRGLSILCGPNGSGKSTLLKLLAGQISPKKGKALIDGEPSGHMPARKRAQKLAFVSQLKRADYDFTVFDAVMMGRYSRMPFFHGQSARDAEAVEKALERVGAAQFKKRGLRELSGGELQRVFLARALAQESPYLLLDEPITGLDIRFQHEFLALVRELCEEGVCAVCVLHDLALAAQYSNRLALISRGSLRALGAPNEVLNAQTLEEVFKIRGSLFKHNNKYYLEMFN